MFVSKKDLEKRLSSSSMEDKLMAANQRRYDDFKARMQEEETRKATEAKQKADNTRNGKNQDGTPKDGWQIARDIGAGLGEGLWKSGADVVGSGASLVSSLVSGDKSNDATKETDKWKKTAEKWGNDVGANDTAATIGNLPGGIVAGIADPAAYMVRGVRNTPEMIAASIAAGSNDKNLRKQGIEEQKKLQDKLFGSDVTKQGDLGMLMEGIAKPAEAIVNVATGGAGSAATQAGKSVAKTAIKEGAKNVAAGVPTSLLEQGARGQEITPGSVAQDAAMQGLIGGTIGGVAGARAKSKVAKDGTTTTPDTTTAADSSQKALPAGFKDNAHYDAELQRYSKMEFTPEDNVWKDRQVTLKDGSTVDLNAIDKEINANARAMSDLQKQASGIDDNTGKATVPDGVDPSTYTGDVLGRAKAMEKFTELKSRNEQLVTVKDKAAQITGVSTEMQLDPKKVRDNYVALQSEAKAAKEYNYNISGRPPEAIKSEIAAIDNGDIPDSLKTPEPLAKDTTDVIARSNDSNLIAEAHDINQDRLRLNEQADSIMTRERAVEEKNALDEKLMASKERLSQYPEERQKYEMEEVMAEYYDGMAKIDDEVKADSEAASTIEEIKANLDKREQELLGRYNQYIREVQPSHADPVLIEEHKAKLEAELADANKYTTQAAPEKISEGISKYGDIVDAVKADPGRYATALSRSSSDFIDELADSVAKAGDRNKSTRLTMLKAATSKFTFFSHRFDDMGLRNAQQNVMRGMQDTIRNTEMDIDIISKAAREIGEGKYTAEQAMEMLQSPVGDLEKFSGLGELADMIKRKGAIIKQDAYNKEIAKLREANSSLKKPMSEEDMIIKASLKADRATLPNYAPHYSVDGGLSPSIPRDGKGGVDFASLEHRTGTEEYNKDAIEVMKAYVVGFNKKFYLEPTLDVFDDPKITSKLRDFELKTIDDYKKQVLNKTKSTAEATMDNVFNAIAGDRLGPSATRRVLGAQRMWSAVSAMGLNVGSGIRNTSQANNIVLAIGSKNTSLGAADATRELLQFAKTRKVTPALQEIIDAGVYDNNAIASMGDYVDAALNGNVGGKSATGKIGENMMFMVTGTDRFLRTQAFLGAKRDGAAKGLTGRELIDYAAKVSVDTNFITSRMDMPPAFNGPIVRSLAQFATYPAAQAQFLAKYGIKSLKVEKSSGGGYKLADPSQFGRLLQFSMANAATVALLAPIGFQAQELVPFFNEVSEGKPFASPLTRVLLGDSGKAGLKDVLYGDATPEKFLYDNIGNLVPGGAQGKKTVEAIDTVQSGESKNAKGKTQFLYDNSNSSDNIRALLFGKYATNEGSAWVNGGMKTLSDKQTQQIQGLPHDKKQQYYDYYMSAKQDVKTTFATGRNEAISKIKETAKTNEALARQMAEEYNAKVDSNMGKYWAKHQDMPSRLQDEMFNELRIDATKQIDSAKKRPSLRSIQTENRYAAEDMGL